MVLYIELRLFIIFHRGVAFQSLKLVKRVVQ
jgi:hypothetical protein